MSTPVITPFGETVNIGDFVAFANGAKSIKHGFVTRISEKGNLSITVFDLDHRVPNNMHVIKPSGAVSLSNIIDKSQYSIGDMYGHYSYSIVVQSNDMDQIRTMLGRELLTMWHLQHKTLVPVPALYFRDVRSLDYVIKEMQYHLDNAKRFNYLATSSYIVEGNILIANLKNLPVLTQSVKQQTGYFFDVDSLLKHGINIPLNSKTKKLHGPLILVN